MRYSVFVDSQLIGESDLEHDDLSMGVVFGTFLPTPAYDRVQHVFRLFAQGRADEYYAARDALGLQLRTAEGVLVPTSAIHIVDFSAELTDCDLQLEAYLKDADSWPCLGGFS